MNIYELARILATLVLGGALIFAVELALFVVGLHLLCWWLFGWDGEKGRRH